VNPLTKKLINTPEQFQKVGKIKDAHGLKGEVFVLVFSKDTSWNDDLTHAKIESVSPEGQNQILEVERLKEHKDGLIVKFKGIEDRNQSEAIKGWSFLVPEDVLVSEEGETIYLKEVLNFQVFLRDQFVGYVKSFSSNGIQDLLVIQQDDHNYEVPFVSDFILNIDFQAQKLFMDFPEDLMNLDKVD
jgi:16S rRNA processing protein RimM